MKAAYLRVSTDEQKKGKTIKGQELAIRKFLGKEPDIIYKDEGWSGGLLARPELDKLRAAIREGNIEELYFYHPDRLSRKQEHQFLLLGEFEKSGVKVVFTSLPDFFEGSKESQVINKSIWSMVSELERLRISERFRLGKLRKVDEGKIITSYPPYGFRYIKGKHRFKHHPHEILVLKMILNWALEGKSDNEIIKELLKRRIKTRHSNDVWAKSTIHKILKTNLSVYSGTWFWNKYKQTIPQNPVSKKKYKHSEKSSRVLNDREEWIRVDLPKHLAIITKEQANIIRRHKMQNKAVKKGNIKHEYLLQGKIFCTFCKGLNYCDTFHKVPYYRCADRKRSYPYPPKCPGGSIKGEALEKAVWNKLATLVADPELVKKEAEKYIERKADDNIASPEIADFVKRKLAIQKEKEKLSEGYTKGFVDNGSMAIQTKRIKQELSVIGQEEKELISRSQKAESLDINSLTEDIELLVEEAKDVLGQASFKEKRDILSWLSVKVSYFKHEYSIEGAITIPTKRSSKLHIINL